MMKTGAGEEWSSRPHHPPTPSAIVERSACANRRHSMDKVIIRGSSVVLLALLALALFELVVD